MNWLRNLIASRTAGGPPAGVCITDQTLVLTSGAGRRWLSASAPRPADPHKAAEVLAGLADKLLCRGQAVVLGLPLSSYAMLQIDRPTVPHEELAEAARWLIRDSVDFDVEQAVVQVFDAPGAGGRNREQDAVVNVVAARSEPLRELGSIIRGSGLRLQGIDIAELALRNVSCTWSAGDETTATVFLAARQGVIQVSRADALLFSRRLDYGLNTIGPFDPAATGIHNRLPLELQRTLDYFDSHFDCGPVGNLLICPDQSDFVGFMRDVAEMSGLRSTVVTAQGSPGGEQTGEEPASGEAWLAVGAALGRSLREPARSAA